MVAFLACFVCLLYYPKRHSDRRRKRTRFLRELCLPRHGTLGPIRRTLYARMRGHLVLVVSHRRLGNRAYIALARLEHVRVVGWKHCRRGADNGAQPIIHFLGLGLVDAGLERGARGCCCVVGGDGRVRMQVVVVVCCCAYDGALMGVVSIYIFLGGTLGAARGYVPSGRPLQGL